MATYQLPPPAPKECNGDVSGKDSGMRMKTTQWPYNCPTNNYAEIQAATLKTIMGTDFKQILN